MSVYALADLHGSLDIFNEIMNYLQPDDKVYFLGDAIDRGKEPIEILRRLLDDPRVTFIKGNHEDMMLRCLSNYDPETWDDNDFHWDYDMELWFYNGGNVTYDQFMKLSKIERYSLIQKMKNMPFICAYENIVGEIVYLCHAGCDGASVDTIDEEKAIWDRNHYGHADSWHGADNEIVVHGHTPIPLLIEEQERIANMLNLNIRFPKEETLRGAYWYAKGHKCCIDCGTVWSDQSVLLNLDTWEQIVFEVK